MYFFDNLKQVVEYEENHNNLLHCMADKVIKNKHWPAFLIDLNLMARYHSGRIREIKENFMNFLK